MVKPTVILELHDIFSKTAGGPAPKSPPEAVHAENVPELTGPTKQIFATERKPFRLGVSNFPTVRDASMSTAIPAIVVSRRGARLPDAVRLREARARARARAAGAGTGCSFTPGAAATGCSSTPGTATV